MYIKNLRELENIMLNIFLVCDAVSVLENKLSVIVLSNKTRNYLNTMNTLGCAHLLN